MRKLESIDGKDGLSAELVVRDKRRLVLGVPDEVHAPAHPAIKAFDRVLDAVRRKPAMPR